MESRATMDPTAVIDRRYRLARDALQHLFVGRKFLHEHEQTLDGFSRFMAREAPADQVDFLKLPRLHEKLFPARAGKEDIDGWINALITDLAIEHHLHVAGAFELLEDQLIHAAAGFDQRGGHNGE